MFLSVFGHVFLLTRAMSVSNTWTLSQERTVGGSVKMTSEERNGLVEFVEKVPFPRRDKTS